MKSIEESYQIWDEEIGYFAEANSVPRSRAFFEIAKDILIENGDAIDLNYSPFISGDERAYDNDGNEIKQPDMRVDAFQFDNEAGRMKEYTLCLMDLKSGTEPQNMITGDIETSFKKVERFIKECIDKRLVDRLDSGLPYRSWILEFTENFKNIEKINIILVSNGVFTGRKKEFPSKDILEKRTTFQLFDLSRYREILNSKTGLEPISIDMDDYDEFELPCLKISKASDVYQSYLVSVPGGWLSQIYEDYATKLLEQNVRTYLQARGNVNKGILKTISDSPSMFFAYNNGLTTTAASVEIGQTKDGMPCIAKLSNFQIVNGGQTTASMFYASARAKSDLSKVFVQMKLSVVNPEVLDDVVSNISRFANTQNSVSNADFFANHPFHRYFEKTCQEEEVPRKEGATISRRWFYERANGSYQNKTLYASASQRRSFEERFPKDQLIKKPELARYLVSFLGRPDRVSMGGDAAFRYLSNEFGDSTEFYKIKHKYGVEWYKEAIAKTIIFRALDKLILKSEWDEGGGTKAINVTYTIAWLQLKLKSLDKAIDFQKIWKRQQISTEMEIVLETIAKQMLEALKKSAEKEGTMTSPTMWARRQPCWENIKKLDFDLRPESAELIDEFTVSQATSKATARVNNRIQREYNKLKDYVVIVSIKPSSWTAIREYSALHKVPETPDENTVLRKLENLQAGKIASEVDAKKAFTFLKKLKNQTDFDFSEIAPSLFL